MIDCIPCLAILLALPVLAADDGQPADAGAVSPQEAQPIREEFGVMKSGDRDWWAFRPLEKPAVP